MCSDLLKPRGYARSRGYFMALLDRMRSCGATTIEEFSVHVHFLADAGIDVFAPGYAPPPDHKPWDLRGLLNPSEWTSLAVEAPRANTRRYLERLAANPRYSRAATGAIPRKIGRHLQLFDCISCDKCIPVCPNDANFTFVVPPMRLRVEKVRLTDAGWTITESATLDVVEQHQIGNFADFCNDCGNCDVFCPEDGGPYIVKPRFFGSLGAWEADAPRDGFFVTGTLAAGVVYARFNGREYVLVTRGDEVAFRGEGFDVSFARGRALETLHGTASVEVDLTYARIMDCLHVAALDPSRVNYINCLDTTASVAPRADRRSTEHDGEEACIPPGAAGTQGESRP